MTWTIEMSNKELHRKSGIESVLEKRESQKKGCTQTGHQRAAFSEDPASVSKGGPGSRVNTC